MEEGTRFYSQLYTQRDTPSQEDPKLNDFFLRLIPVEKMSYKGYQILLHTITVDDLYSSLSAMKLNKVSGLDGLNVEFYRAFWPLVGKLVHASLMYGHEHGRLSDSQCRGILRLIPKRNKDLFSIANWRPITLLNIYYKLLSKTLATTLASILPDLIHQDQRGFICHRYIGTTFWICTH